MQCNTTPRPNLIYIQNTANLSEGHVSSVAGCDSLMCVSAQNCHMVASKLSCASTIKCLVPTIAIAIASKTTSSRPTSFHASAHAWQAQVVVSFYSVQKSNVMQEQSANKSMCHNKSISPHS